MNSRNKYDHRRAAPGGYLCSGAKPFAQDRTDVQLAHELIGEVAAELEWTADRRRTLYPSWDITAPDDSGHSLYVTYASGRLHITGAYPPDCHSVAHVADMPSIGVSANRSAQAITAEVRRRLLPNYWKPFAAVAKARESENRHRKRTEAEANRLGAILDDTRAMEYANYSTTLYARAGEITATLRVQAGTTCMDLRSVPATLAADILTLIRRAA